MNPELLAALEARAPNADGVGCFLCKWILQDLKENGKLTDQPYDYNHISIFPARSKILHMEVEDSLRPFLLKQIV